MGATSVAAQAVESFARYQGTVEARDADTLTIRRAAGGSVTVLMNVKTRLFIATAGRLRDIKPESYVSIVSVPGADGKPKPIKVAIYSPSERGFEAGTKPWDAAPDARLTAGWIGGLSLDPPRQVELVYDGGSKSFTIPPGTPTAQIAPGERALLVPGADVVVLARTDADGLVNADLVAVGRAGTEPTL
ncbi:hypothetical protein MKK64_07730 [Methylobacterium sp. E-025]|uniref:hypothetical protein n=1 Tax=Methylobacterium sp. E-025 TaxID=2836561 RepID=UPI001FB91B86|nr:hypothetical protein [Methylobacterium sp. E-025]MCJ2111079.1 hypothetical protein [Methylobacterium sp. E-025]